MIPKANAKPAVTFKTEMAGLTAADDTIELRNAVGKTFAASLAGVAEADVLVTPAPGRRRMRQLAADDLKYDVLIASKDDAAAKALATKVSAIKPAALTKALKDEMEKVPALKALKTKVKEIPAPAGAAAKSVAQVKDLLAEKETALKADVKKADDEIAAVEKTVRGDVHNASRSKRSAALSSQAHQLSVDSCVVRAPKS